MEFKDYKHSIPIQIRFNDIDRLNHVNNACYLTFFELGRVNYFNTVLKDCIDWDKEGFILARTELDHLLPVFLNDEVYCFTKIIRLGNKSLTIRNSVVKKVNASLIECASGTGVLVAMDYINQVSIDIPKSWRERIDFYEK